MPNLLKSFQNFIRRHKLFQSKDKLMVAVSGGVDSIVLSHLLHQSGYDISLVHCNFGLRGEASDQDEEFVNNFAKAINAPLHSKSFETQGYADEKKVSIQMAARELRYEWFFQLLDSENFDLLLTAHHASDQIETILFNLTKGTGISGLRGMKIISNYTVRPLLFATKEDLVKYAKEEGLSWREDASNTSDKYHRNRIRNRVIPELKKINPGIEKTMMSTAKRLASLEIILKNETEKIKVKHLHKTSDGYKLDLSWFNSDLGGLAILEETLKEFGANLDQCISIAESLDTGSGNQFNTNAYNILMDRNSLLITSEGSEEFEITINHTDSNIDISDWHFSFELTTEKVVISNDKNVALLDADLVTFPLKARNWHKGDRFYPLGMKQEKKVSDFMIDEKIPVNLKKRLVLFESKHEIVWLAGHRISNRYKITPKTKSTLIIKMINNA